MNDIEAFVGCHGRMATHRVNLEGYVSGAPNGSGCFTRFGDDLLLCDSCTGFWLHHLGLRGQTALERAVELRGARPSRT